jgi:plasmid stabilization system protein ParE
MALRLREEAEREFNEAVVCYEEDYPGRGRRFAEAVRGEIERIREAPHTFPRCRQRPAFRFAVVPRFPYKLIFREEPGPLVVVYAVAHDKRKAAYWQKK